VTRFIHPLGHGAKVPRGKRAFRPIFSLETILKLSMTCRPRSVFSPVAVAARRRLPSPHLLLLLLLQNLGRRWLSGRCLWVCAMCADLPRATQDPGGGSGAIIIWRVLYRYI
jgi:hypothetical protein